jgi:hypothetical protein
MSGERTTRVGEFERGFTAALLAGDQIAAETTIREAMDAKLSTADIDEGIITPALWQIGELWERGEINVADEHLATEISMRVLALQPHGSVRRRRPRLDERRAFAGRGRNLSARIRGRGSGRRLGDTCRAQLTDSTFRRPSTTWVWRSKFAGSVM